MRQISRAVVGFGLALLSVPLLADPPSADQPHVRYVPQSARSIDDLRVGPNGDLLVTFSAREATRVWLRGRLRHVLAGHVAAISPDGRWIATGTSHQQRTGQVRLFSAEDGGLRFMWDSGPIRQIEFSPDGRYVVSGGADGWVHVWAAETGELLHRWQIQGYWVQSIAFGSQWVAFCSTREVQVRHLASGQLRLRSEGEHRFTNCLLSPDGTWIVTTDQDGSAEIFELATAAQRLVLLHGARIDWAAISPGGRTIVTAGGGTLQSWHAANGERQWRVDVDRLSDLAMSPDGRRVFVGTHGYSAYAFDLETGQRSASYDSHPFAAEVDLSPDGRVIAVARSGFRLYDTATGAEILNVSPNPSPIEDLGFSPDGRFLLGSYRSRGVVVWDLAGDGSVFRTDGKEARWTGRGALFLAGGKCCGGQVRLWDADTRTLHAELRHPQAIVAADAAPDGSILVTASETGQVRVWNGWDGQRLSELSAPKSRPVALQVPTSDLVAVGYDDGSVSVWKDGGLEPWQTFRHESREPVGILRDSSDGQFLASATLNEGQLVVWDLAGGPHRTFPGRLGSRPDDLGFVPGGSELLVAWGRPDLTAWDLETGDRRSMPVGSAEITSLAVSTNGRWKASGDISGEIHLWQDGVPERRVFAGLTPPVRGVAIDPRDRWLAGADADGITIVWNLATGQEIVRLATLDDGGWAVTTPDGRWDANEQGRRGSGLLAWDRGQATTLANLPRYRAPGLLSQVMAPWRQAEADSDAGAASDTPATVEGRSDTKLDSPWAQSSPGSSLRPRPERIQFERLLTLRIPGGAESLSVDGRRVAVAGHQAVRLFDVSNSKQPSPGGEFRLRGRGSVDLLLTPDRLFATDTESLYSIEVSDVIRPERSAEWEGDYPRGMAIRGNHVFLTDGIRGLHVLDVETPESPKLVATIAPSQMPDAFVDVVLDGRFAYVGTAINANAGLEILEIADPTNPRTVGHLDVAGSSVHELALHDGHLLVAAGDGGLHIFDVREPRRVRWVSNYDSLYLRGMARVGDMVFLADYVEGLLVVDISDPKAPTLIGQHGPSDLGENAEAADVVVLDENLLLVSLGPGGLQVLRWSETSKAD